MGEGGGVGWAERLLTFSAFRMGVYSRWALIRSWAPIRINTVIFYWQEKSASIEGGSWGNARKRVKLQKSEISSTRKNILLESKLGTSDLISSFCQSTLWVSDIAEEEQNISSVTKLSRNCVILRQCRWQQKIVLRHLFVGSVSSSISDVIVIING